MQEKYVQDADAQDIVFIMMFNIYQPAVIVSERRG